MPVIQGTVHNRKEFTGKEFDNEGFVDGRTAGLGLYYFGARFYDPETGMWTSTDPIDEMFNSYSYCRGNPVNYIDLFGLETGEGGEPGNPGKAGDEGDSPLPDKIIDPLGREWNREGDFWVCRGGEGNLTAFGGEISRNREGNDHSPGNAPSERANEPVIQTEAPEESNNTKPEVEHDYPDIERDVPNTVPIPFPESEEEE